MHNSVIFEGVATDSSHVKNGETHVKIIGEALPIGEAVRVVGRLTRTSDDLFGEIGIQAEHVELSSAIYNFLEDSDYDERAIH